MAIHVKAERPMICWDYEGADGVHADHLVRVNGTEPEWDWLFRELIEANKVIPAIKLIRQFNPGMTLRDAKVTYETMKGFWGKTY